MQWYQVLIYILLLILVIMLAVFIFNIATLLSFKRKLERREVAFSVLFVEKQEVLLSIYGMFDGHKEDIKSTLVDLATQVRWMKFEKLKNEDINKIASMLDEFEKKLSRLGHKFPEYESNKDYVIYWHTLEDLDSNYRRNVANYDSEVEGYEYWRRFLLFRPLLAILPFKKKSRVH